MPADLPRFHCEDLQADTVELAGAEAHHAVGVLRLGEGAVVELFDGCGTVVTARVRRSSRRAVELEVQQRRQVRRAVPAVRLAFAVPKGRRLDWLLEKATELGAAALWPVVFERSVAGGGELSGHKRERWGAQCIAAAKQCGLDLLPEIREAASLDQYLRARRAGVADATGAVCGLLGDLDQTALGVPSALALGVPAALAAGRTAGTPATIDILVGPEGGLTPSERAAAIGAGMVPVRIGSTVLRVETAAVALLSAVIAWAAP